MILILIFWYSIAIGSFYLASSRIDQYEVTAGIVAGCLNLLIAIIETIRTFNN